jgi:biotin carboxylase
VFKNDCRIALKQAGVRSPKFEVLSEEELIQNGPQVVDIPFVVKPTRGFGKQFSAVCKTQADFKLFVSTLRATRLATDPMINLIVNSEYIVEQYVQGTLHSAEVVVRGGKVEFFATTTRYRAHFNDLLEMGYSMPAGLPETKRRELHRYLQDVFSALGLVFGLYHVEVILAKDGPYLVEINGRMMGGVGPQVYQALSERNAFELLLQLHLDEDIQVDEKLIKGAGTVVLMGAREEGVIDENFTQSKLNSLLGRYGISFCTLNLQAGQHVRKFEGNLSALGHVIVQGADQVSSAKKGHEFLLELDTLLGLELAKYYKLEEADIPV